MSENEKFENLAAQFKAETGIWPPGKAMPVGMTPQDERMVRSEFFAYWMANRRIPVSEGLPKKGETVIFLYITEDNRIIDYSIILDYQAQYNSLNVRMKAGFTHWKPIVLPETGGQSVV